MAHLVDTITGGYLQKQTELDDPPVFTSEAIALIKKYLRPYLDQIDQWQTADIFLQKIGFINGLPEKLQDNIWYSLKFFEKKQFGDRLKELKFFFRDHLVFSIIFGDNDEYFNGTDVIDPWDVIIQFRSSQVPRELFHLTPLTEDEEYERSPVTVDVDVTVNGIRATYPMSQELVYGIIAFYKELGRDHPLSIEGETFTFETNKIAPNPQAVVINTNGYTIRINGKVYSFYTPYYIQGLLSAAKWLGVNPRNYLSDLIKYEYIRDATGILGQGHVERTPMDYV